MMIQRRADGWDAFISYASEDLDTVAKPLADLLTAFGVAVWFDKTALKVGDSLRRTIDRGLNQSRYGIVLLSNSFFGKHWPEAELNGLAQREVDGEKVILPVWLDVDAELVRSHSPILADRVALKWAEDPLAVVIGLLEVIRPDFLEKARDEFKGVHLPLISRGRELTGVVGGSQVFLLHNDETQNEEDVEAVGAFLQQIQDLGDIWSELDPAEHVRVESSLRKEMEELRELGWDVYGAKVPRRWRIGDHVEELMTGVVAVIRTGAKAVFLQGDDVAVFRQGKQTGNSSGMTSGS